jgi:hypothetical protein
LGGIEEVRKASGSKASAFFFEKKNQKTFLRLASVCGQARQFEDLMGVWDEAGQAR